MLFLDDVVFFRCYFTERRSFNDILRKRQSFDAIEPIFPLKLAPTTFLVMSEILHQINLTTQHSNNKWTVKSFLRQKMQETSSRFFFLVRLSLVSNLLLATSHKKTWICRELLVFTLVVCRSVDRFNPSKTETREGLD